LAISSDQPRPWLDFNFRSFFADEVRALGRLLNIPAPLVQRHPFPGPGLAIRILGPVTREQVKILQHADSIYIEEIRKAGLYNQISQAFAVLLPVRAVGVMGDKRTYEQASSLVSLGFAFRISLSKATVRLSHYVRSNQKIS